MASDYVKIKTFCPHGYSTKITLYRRKSDSTPNIYFYFTFNGNIYRESTRTAIIELAERYSMKRFMDIHRQRGVNRKILKFKKLVAKFIAYKETKVAEDRLSIKTLNEYKRQCKFLVERFKGKTIDTFAKQDFTGYKDWRKQYYTAIQTNKVRQSYYKNNKKIKGRMYDYSMETAINRELSLLKSLLLFGKNELELPVITKVPTWEKYDENKGREILTDKEINKLITYWKQKNIYYWYILTFVATTGIRYPSELSRLKWKDVDLENEYIIIRNRKGRTKKKGDRDMSLPVLDVSKDILIKLRQRENVPNGNDDYVFVDHSGKRIYDIKKSFYKSLLECGITDKHITLYTLRHFFATKMLLMGMSPIYLASILGHTSTTMIERHYGKILIHDKIKIMKETLEEQEVKDKEQQDKLKEQRETAKLRHAYESWFK